MDFLFLVKAKAKAEPKGEVPVKAKRKVNATSSKKRMNNSKIKGNARRSTRKALQNLLDGYKTIDAPNGCIIEDRLGIHLIVLVWMVFPSGIGKEINVST